MNVRSLSLDDLIALNAEIGALVRSGVPLEQGLSQLGADLSGRLGKFATALSERTARGEPLDQALLADARLPAVYRAVVEAGVRAGHLPAALEAVAAAARRLAETSRTASMAVVYPLLVFLCGWAALVFFAVAVAPRLAMDFADFDVPGQRFLAGMASAGGTAWYWAPIVPVVVILFFLVWWWTCTRAGMLQVGRGDWLARRIPWFGSMLRWTRAATFLELLALLVENRLPLPDALVLAAEASGDPAMRDAARRMANSIAQGQARPPIDDPAFPPMVNWILGGTNHDGTLVVAIRHAAAAYHRRAQHESDVLRVLLPVTLSVAIGGTVTMACALALFGPYVSILDALSR